MHKLILYQVYIIIAILCQLMFWLVPSFHVSAIFVALQGVFLGPLFPAVIVATTKALPPYLHVSVIGFAAAIGVGGGAALPFAIGSLAQAKGLAAHNSHCSRSAFGTMALLPKTRKKENRRRHAYIKARGAAEMVA